MSELSKRSTVYFEPEIHQALKIKSAITHQSLSQVVNEAIRLALQEDRYEELLEDLTVHGKL